MDVWSRSANGDTWREGKALPASEKNKRVVGAAFARGECSYALERNPSTVRYAAAWRPRGGPNPLQRNE